MNLFLDIDLELFFFINQTLSNSFFDWLMPLFDRPHNWLPFIGILWATTCYRDKKHRMGLLILVPVTILISDQIGGYIKHFELRDRPWFELGTDVVRHLGGTGGKHLSFPSNHAANVASMAFLFSFFYPNFKKYFWSLAITIMFSRVYIGVHYPLDVLAGFLLGLTVSLCLTSIWKIWNTDVK